MIKKSVNILKQKIDIKILTGFLTVCGRFFFLSKNSLTQNIDGSNLFDIFLPVVNILTTLQYFDECVGSCQNFDQKFSPKIQNI